MSATPPPIEGSPYGDLTLRLVQGWQTYAPNGMKPDHAARRMIRAIERRNAPWRIPIGAGANWLPRLRFFIGDRVFLHITKRLFGLT